MLFELVRGRFVLGDGRIRTTFQVVDNEASLASTAAFPTTFNSKVVVDDGNYLEGRDKSESFRLQRFVLDNATGEPAYDSLWPNHRHTTVKTWLARGRQRLWEIRQLLHALRGPQTSWYLPSFSEDFEAVGNFVSGSALLDVANWGYTRQVGSLPPRNVLRVVFNDGTPTIYRTILSSAEGSPTLETLTVDSNWGVDKTPADVERIELVEHVRFADDRIRMEHRQGQGTTRIAAPVVAVLA